jgi:cobalt-zinc-cadmium efflux system outer membrane protein
MVWSGLPLVLMLAAPQRAAGVLPPGSPPNQAARAAPAAPLAGSTLTLDEAVRLARAAAPARTAAAARAAGASEAVPFAGRWRNPSVEVRSENWRFGSGSDDPALDNFAVVSQPIELGGKRGARRALAAADAEVAGAELAQAERDAVLEVAAAYLAAVRARALTELLGTQREGGSGVIALMKRRVEEGYSAEADLRKYEAEVARVDAQLLRAWLDLGRACAFLAARLGLAADVEPSQLVEPALPAPLSGDFSDLARAAAERAPEVVAARRRHERAQAALAVERSRAVPDPIVSGGYKRTSDANTGVLGVALPVPLFDRNGDGVARATGEERAAALEAEAAVRLARAEIDAELRAAAALAERAQQTERELLAPVDVARQAARASFREGGSDVLLRLVDAERVYIEAHRDGLDLKLDAILASLRARLALGQEIAP